MNEQIQNEDGTLNADAILGKPEMKHPKLKLLWFWLTCWRPITKYEIAKQSDSFMKLCGAVINNYNNLHRLSQQMQKMLALLAAKGVIDLHSNETQQDEQPPQQETSKKDDIMFN